jgi:hypothetical protein
MKHWPLLIISLVFLPISASAYESIILTGGIARQNPNGAFQLQSNYALFAGAGLEILNDVYLLLKLGFPAQYETEVYPLNVTINGAEENFNFHKFTAFDLMLDGHYSFRIAESAKIRPKLFGGLGLHWLYNSQVVAGESNVLFSGLGPEFGLGAIFEIHKNVQLDFTFSVKFPYYNDYKNGSQKTPVGLDEQIMGFNFTIFYLLSQKNHEFDYDF